MAPSAPADPAEAGDLQPPGLLSLCPALSSAQALCVAVSGGLDSTVLLHLLWQLRAKGLLTAPLRALHIHHGLQAAADSWLEHCRQQCLQWDIAFTGKHVNASASSGESPEAAAREARYQAYATELQAGEVLVLAHHGDDQAETLLLRLMRGSGVAGLAGMPQARLLAAGSLLRPLLGLHRHQLEHYAQAHGLQFVEDPSNADHRFDRNFVRAEILPRLQHRWPSAAASLLRSAELLHEADTLLQELAALDLLAAVQHFPNRLSLPVLRQLSPARQRNLLRYWLEQQPVELAGPAPSYQLLHRCVRELIKPASAEYLMMAWGKGSQARQLHRYRDTLYLLRPLPPVPAACSWNPQTPLQLPTPLGSLHWDISNITGTASLLPLNVKFRGGSERVTKADGHHQSLKHYWQARGIPPWLRGHVPLLYHGSALIAVGEEIMPDTILAHVVKNVSPLYWQRSHLLCGW